MPLAVQGSVYLVKYEKINVDRHILPSLQWSPVFVYMLRYKEKKLFTRHSKTELIITILKFQTLLNRSY